MTGMAGKQGGRAVRPAHLLGLNCAVLVSLALGSLALAQPSGSTAAVKQGDGSQTAAEAKAAEPALERRIRLLARELDLNASQQESVRRILEDQQAQVRAVLSDPRVVPNQRGAAIGAIQERTADQIRAVLSEEQKQKYHKAKPTSAGSPHPDVQTWLDVANGKRPPPGPRVSRGAGGDG